jgi:acetyl esterase/lipase
MRRSMMALVACLVGSSPLVAQAPDTVSKLPLEKDIVYGEAGGEKLLLDVCKPPKGTKPFPVVVCVHGGSWRSGGRAQFHQWIGNLAENGYFAVSIEYRLAPKSRWPAQIEDVKCAVRFMRSKAKEWDLDSDRIALMGRSAGGHLVLMGALSDGFEGSGGHAEFSSKVRCVVNYCGPTNFPTFRPTPAGDKAFLEGVKLDGDGVLREFLGTADRSAAVMKSASPITYVAKTNPPVLTFHGTDDQLVPVSQAKELHVALDKAGVVNRLELFEGKGHGWDTETQERTEKIRLEFLDRYLKK